MLQGIRFQVQVLKPCKSVQESSEEVLDFKARQISYLSRFMKISFLELISIQSVNRCFSQT